jgi:hypothetical protein
MAILRRRAFPGAIFLLRCRLARDVPAAAAGTSRPPAHLLHDPPESRWLLGEFEREPWRSELLEMLAT